MRSGTLYISFWNISFDNLPVGSFTHRSIAPSDAAFLIASARRENRLMCVSKNDLVAPYSERECERHEELLAVLKEQFGIEIDIEEFLNSWEDDGVRYQSINPLRFAEVKGVDRLLVVNCSYTMKEKLVNPLRHFEISPTSVSFSIFEAA